MSRVVCPCCQTPVHPLLGEAPLIVGDRVVVYCSDACRQEGLSTGRTSSEPGPEVVLEIVDDAPAMASTDRVREIPVPTFRLGRLLAAVLVATGVLLLVGAGYLLLEHVMGSEPHRSAGGGGDGLTAAEGGGRSEADGNGGAAAPGILDGSDAAVRSVGIAQTRRKSSLLELKKRSWSMLEGFLLSRTGRFWRTAAKVLAEQGHTGALQALRKALVSQKWANRQRAAEALARLGHAEGLEALKRDLNARRKPVKWASAFALARCGDSAGVGVIKQLAYFRQHRMTSYEALVRLGNGKGKTHLRKVFRKSKAKYDRLRAAVALGMVGDRTGIGLLKERLKEPGMHMGVALALQKLGAKEAREALVRALGHTALRVEAARALRAYGDVTLVSEMAQQLDSLSEDSRLTAAAAIVILTAQARAEVR